MSELSEQEQRRLEKAGRKLEAMNRSSERRREREAAARQFWALLSTWTTEHPDYLERTYQQASKEVKHLVIEAHKGKIEHIEERFQRAMELAVASTLPRKRQTYLKFSTALRQLTDLNSDWLQAEKRSKAEQDHMLRKLRLLLLEIEAGHTEDIAERFQQTTHEVLEEAEGKE